MPELPEVETVRIQLLNKVIGKTIERVEVFHAKTVAFDKTIKRKLKGKTIKDIDRVGKLLVVEFTDQSDLWLLVHLKMTGQLIFADKRGRLIGGGHTMTGADTEKLPGRHTRSAFHFSDGSSLYFNDMRLFGYTKLTNRAGVEKARAGYGPEPLAAEFDCEWFQSALRRRRTTVKAALLDQKFISGLGNIYVDEALWRAKVRPTRRADRLKKSEALALCQAAGAVLRESIAVGGTTFRDFVDTGGQQGNFTDYLQVFGRQGENCTRCGKIIEKTRTAGRGTHYCPGCQK